MGSPVTRFEIADAPTDTSRFTVEDAKPDYSDTLARSAKPTQFENERQPNRQPGVTRSLLSEVGDAVKSAPNMVRGMFDPATNARRGAALFEHDQDRAATRSPLYRAVADVGEAGGVNAPGMEHDADIGNRRGIVGKMTGDALMLAGPAAADMGLTAAKGRFPNYKAPEPRPFNWDKAVNKTTLGGALDLMSPNPTVGKAALTAGAGLATEAVPWLANKVARSKPVVDFMTKRPAGTGPVPERVPLWKQAGIQEGKPAAGSNVQVTQVPEPTARPKSAPAVRSPLWKDVEAEGHGEPNVQVTHPPEPTARPHREPAAEPQLKSAGDTATRLAGQPKNLATDMTEAESAPAAEAPKSISATSDFPDDSPAAREQRGEKVNWFNEFSNMIRKEHGSDAARQFELNVADGIKSPEESAAADTMRMNPKANAGPVGKPTPPDLPKTQGGNLPIGDAQKDAFARFVKSKGKEGPLAPKRSTGIEKVPKPKDSADVMPSWWPEDLKKAAGFKATGKPRVVPKSEPVKSPVSRRPDMQDDQAVRQEIEQRTQVRPKEPGRKGKAQLAADMKAGKPPTKPKPKSLMDELSEGSQQSELNDASRQGMESVLEDEMKEVNKHPLSGPTKTMYDMLNMIPKPSAESQALMKKYGYKQNNEGGLSWTRGRQDSGNTLNWSVSGDFYNPYDERGAGGAPTYRHPRNLEEYLKNRHEGKK